MITYRAFFMDKQTHKVVMALDIKSDGYLTALADARNICANNHSELYVGQVAKL